jgi:hypothetical protein
MIELVSGPDPYTVIRDRNPTAAEERALRVVGGSWIVRDTALDGLVVYKATWGQRANAGKPRPGIIWRAVDSTGEPIAITVGDEK